MSKKNILLAITQGFWLIDAQSAEQLGHNVAAVLAGEKFWDTDHKSKPEFMIVESISMGSYYSSSISNAKPGSVAVINLSGPMMKEDNCGDPGTKTIESLINQASNNPNITGIVIVADTPGGSVHGTQSLSNTISSVSKPVVTLVEDLVASAGYWAVSGSNYIFANTGTARIGSIGTMLSFRDMKPVWESMGAKFHEIYATKSTEKNADFREAEKGNYDKIRQNVLDPLNEEFLKGVIANRGEKLDQKKTLNGQVYLADDAIKYGLIDAIGTLEDAISKVHELANMPEEQPQQTMINPQNQHMKTMTILAAQVALLAFCGAKIEGDAKSVDVELTDELTEKLNATLTAAALSETQISEANKTIGNQATTIKDLQAEVSVLKNPGVSGSQKDGSDSIPETEAEVWALPHNKEALDNPLFN